MDIVHRPAKDHVNADGPSRIPDPLMQCNYYSYGYGVQDLPSGGCKHGIRDNEQWNRFHNGLDDAVPLAVRHISHEGSDIEPYDGVTWVEKYKAHYRKKILL